jgi:hypothetical protein
MSRVGIHLFFVPCANHQILPCVEAGESESEKAFCCGQRSQAARKEAQVAAQQGELAT